MLKVKLIAHTPDPEKIIAAAARFCYSPADTDTIMEKLTDDATGNFINMLMEIGHESPIEHASFTFAIEGVSRSLLAQITRHRIASFSVQSQRYVKENHFAFVVPPEIEKDKKAKEIFLKAMEDDMNKYEELSKILFDRHYNDIINECMDPKKAKGAAEKKASEDSRYVLPNACETKIMMTMNTRSLYNFFKLRACNRAQWEIRDLAFEMLKQCKEVAPVLFSKAGPACLYGPCSEGKMTCGKAKEVREKFGVK